MLPLILISIITAQRRRGCAWIGSASGDKRDSQRDSTSGSVRRTTKHSNMHRTGCIKRHTHTVAPWREEEKAAGGSGSAVSGSHEAPTCRPTLKWLVASMSATRPLGLAQRQAACFRVCCDRGGTRGGHGRRRAHNNTTKKRGGGKAGNNIIVRREGEAKAPGVGRCRGMCCSRRNSSC